MFHMEREHICDNCEKVVERHVFCTIKCSKEYFNAHRRDSRAPVSEEGSVRKTPLTVSKNKPYDTRPCKKHNGSFRGGCGCPPDDEN